MKRVHIRLEVTEDERNLIRGVAAVGGFRSMAEFARITVTGEARRMRIDSIRGAVASEGRIDNEQPAEIDRG